MPVIGTAGHVDHGKSTLVRALTGREPDRWEEERRRGLTIDLGFAWTALEGGEEVSFVDVPGHERFIKNMLAGTEGMDVALLVVAADEGWMPQSEEHLSVLDLLGIDRGVVAITKSDRVDADHLDLVMLEVEEMLAGTSLQGAPLLPTSVPRGVGIDELRAALAKTVAGLREPRLTDRPRLWIDRSFTISGAGTVVTGTLTDGQLAVGDLVELHPGALRARIRGLQSHEKDLPLVEPRRRVAVNLAGVDRESARRGMLLAPLDHVAMAPSLLVRLQTVRSLGQPLTEKGSYHLHLGTGAWPVRMRLLEGLPLRGSGVALLESRAAIPAAVGDRFILREVGRRSVVGGGRVLDPEAPTRTRQARPSVAVLEAVLEGGRDDVATALLEVRGRAQLRTLAAHSRGGRPRGGLVAAGWALSARMVAELTEDALALAAAFHQRNPLRPGIPKASLASSLDVDVGILQAVIDASPHLIDRGAEVATADFSGGLDEAAESKWTTLESALRAAGFSVPRITELGVDSDLLHAFLRLGRLVRISEDLAYLPQQLEELQSHLIQLPAEFTVAQFRDATGTSRKYAIPLLEWFDARGVTVRRGDLRSVRPS